MSAPLAGKFQDHYAVLGVDPKAKNEVIQQAYTELAAKYNPRKGGPEADNEKFEAVGLAFEVLLDPAARASFDSLRPGAAQDDAPQFSGMPFFSSGAGEVTRRRVVLCVMYDRTRHKPIRPGLSMRQLELMVTLTTEELQFVVWYLKARGYAAMDDKSNLQITVDGMEYLDSNFPSSEEIMPYVRQAALAG
jgi:DnaJ domain